MTLNFSAIPALRGGAVALGLCMASAAQSSTVHGMRDYFQSLAGN